MADPKNRGNTIPEQGEVQQREPREPHERDESADSQAADEPSQRRMGRIAQKDVESGLVDTDKGPALDEAYDRTRAGTRSPEKKSRP